MLSVKDNERITGFEQPIKDHIIEFNAGNEGYNDALEKQKGEPFPLAI